MITRGLAGADQVISPNDAGRPLSAPRRAAMVGVNGFAATTTIGGGVALAASWGSRPLPQILAQ
jgi:hypothetical protein